MASPPNPDNWYRQVFDRLDDGACLLRPLPADASDFTTVHANPACRSLLGLSDPGATLWQLLPGSEERLGAALGKVLVSGVPVRLLHQDVSSGLSLDISMSRVDDGDGPLLCLILRDVTASGREAAVLRRRDADFVRVQRLGEVGGLDIDITGGLRSWRSPEYLRLHGLPSDTVEESHAQWRARLHPDDRDRAERNLFDALSGGESRYDGEYRIVRPSDGEVRWIHARADIERDADGIATRLLGVHIDVTEQKRLQNALHQREERQAVLVAELQHRVRNILSIVRSIFAKTMEADGSMEELANHFHGRLDSLARIQSVVTQNGAGIADLETMIRDELLPVGISDGPRLSIRGPQVTLPSTAAASIGLAIHELTTNAVKYGALRFDTASLAIHWGLSGDGSGERRLDLTWTEQGVPALPVNPSRRGYGSGLIEDALPHHLGATTSLEFRGNGICCTLSIPLPHPMTVATAPSS